MKLCLGTVQFGIEYGITASGKPCLEESLKILKRAFELGINTFDTASAYGEAENVLGEFCKGINQKEEINIISKFLKDQDVGEAIKGTLQKIGMIQMNGYLFHDAASMYDSKQKKKILEIKQAGYSQNIGVSTYKEEDAIFAAKQEWIDYIQIPYNAFDQRLDKTNFFKIVKANGKIIFARSVLLQGLLAMKVTDVGKKLSFAQKYVSVYNEITQKYGVNNIEAAIQYVKSNKNIDYIVFGTDSVGQLEEFVGFFNKSNINEDMINELKNLFLDVEDRVVMPNLW